jgi:DNA-binding XRE family transcriptional regulator
MDNGPVISAKKWSSQKVRELRWRLGWSQAELARHLGCRSQTVNDWETGIDEPPAVHARFLTQLEGQTENYVERLKAEPVADALLDKGHSAQITHTEVVKSLEK